MNSINIADELDEAVSRILAGVETASMGTDLELDELAGIAAELQHLPEPEFKVLLKATLTGQSHTADVLRFKSRPANRATEIPATLPTLFGTTADGYPMHQRSLAASLFMHVTALAL